MIDYQKLKLAHELNSKITRYMIRINLYYYGDCFYSLFDLYKSEQIDFDCIDDLITKLQELTKDDEPKSKYKIGQTVWCLDSAEPYTFKIEDMTGDPIRLWAKGISVYEHDCYPTREALIDAQIAHWTCLKNEEISIRSHDVSMTPPFEGAVKGFKNRHDNLKGNKDFTFMHEVAGNSYYRNLKTNEAHCSCGIEADFPHDCECEHQSDGMIYTSNPPQNKCKKCGEFYS